MGEWSRRVGEVGEDIVSELLSLIGWGNAKKNVSIPCIKNQKHARPGTQNRTTHGLDGLFSYQSQLHARVLDHLVISSKYTSGLYPDSPSSTFKAHIRDLAETLECFKNSEVRQTANKSFTNVDGARNIGVIFWLSDKSDIDYDIISKLTNIRNVDDYNFEAIYTVDNCKANFIYSSVNYIKNIYSKSSVEFLYFCTGKNYNPTIRASSGSVLPIEYINSNLLPFKIVEPNGNKRLIITINEGFSKERLARAMGLCQDLTADFADGITVMFPDFNKLKHENDIYEAKLPFADQRFVDSVDVDTYMKNFRR